VESWWPKYLRASQREKSRILDEFVAITGYHRKSAIGRKISALGSPGKTMDLYPGGKGCANLLGPSEPSHK